MTTGPADVSSLVSVAADHFVSSTLGASAEPAGDADDEADPDEAGVPGVAPWLPWGPAVGVFVVVAFGFGSGLSVGAGGTGASVSQAKCVVAASRNAAATRCRGERSGRAGSFMSAAMGTNRTRGRGRRKARSIRAG